MTGVPDETFLPYATQRTLLRRLTPADAPVLAAYRSDPDVARHQGWDLPFTAQDAAELIANQLDLTGPAPGRWIQVGIEHGGELIGDLAIWLDPGGALATLGYTLRRHHQGHGLAIEAVGAAVDRLFALTGVHRIGATADPEHLRSARLLERLGFRYEGRAIAAADVRGEWLDDDLYALLAQDRAAWLDRTTGGPKRVRLVHVDPANVHQVTQLGVHRSQEQFVLAVRDALIEMLMPPVEHGVELTLRFRAVEADGELVGFVVLSEATASNPDPHLRWIAIDRWHQRRGIGGAAVRLAALHEGRDGQEALRSRWSDHHAGPQRFFEAVGFVVDRTANGVAEGRLPVPAASG
jgi:RimJ/RimL family protein N-acetyltransferase